MRATVLVQRVPVHSNLSLNIFKPVTKLRGGALIPDNLWNSRSSPGGLLQVQ